MNINAYPCFAHFVPNCQICFPTKVAVPTSINPNAPPQLTSRGPGGPSGASSAAAPEPEEADNDNIDNGTKRKRPKREYLPYLLPKRKKKTVIDCPVARHFFKTLKLTSNFFNSGRVLAWGLQPDDPNFRNIYDYVAKGQANSFGIKIISIIQIVTKARDLESEEIPFDLNEEFNSRKHRMMLWHGTTREAVASILENGLRLPISGKGGGFGEGIYFADRICNSAGYCRGYIQEGDHHYHAFLFLCDVLLGRMYETNCNLDSGLTSPPPTKSSDGKELRNDSVKACGYYVPHKAGEKVINGCVWPLGVTVITPNVCSYHPLLYSNEYIVYSAKSVRPQYLVKVAFTKHPHYEKIE